MQRRLGVAVHDAAQVSGGTPFGPDFPGRAVGQAVQRQGNLNLLDPPWRVARPPRPDFRPDSHGANLPSPMTAKPADPRREVHLVPGPVMAGGQDAPTAS